MTEGARNRNEFARTLRDVVAKVRREGGDRLERERVEALGERFGMDPEEARQIFVDLQGDAWRGELVGTDDPAGWSAAQIEDAPSTG